DWSSDVCSSDLTLQLPLFIAISVEVSRRVWGMNFIDKHNFTVVLTKLILGIYQDQPFFFSKFCPSVKQLISVFFQEGIVIKTHEIPFKDFSFCDILIVPFVSFG